MLDKQSFKELSKSKRWGCYTNLSYEARYFLGKPSIGIFFIIESLITGLKAKLLLLSFLPQIRFS